MRTATAADQLARAAQQVVLAVLSVLCGGVLPLERLDAQTPSAPPTRLAILQAEDRRAPTPRDLAIIRSGARSRDDQTVRVAVRALGRLERPALIPDIVPALRHELPEIRLEAANAIGQAAQGWKTDPPAASALDAVTAPLAARLAIEEEPDVRAAICETLGRLPYAKPTQAEAAERTLVETAAHAETVTDRLGVAKGLEAFARVQRALRAPGDDALALLRRLATPPATDAAVGARIRRLALEALISAGIEASVLAAASRDPDAQVRRIAMRAAAPAAGSAINPEDAQAMLGVGLEDGSPSVRLEALRTLGARGGAAACAAALAASRDRDLHVVLLALDQLGACGSEPEAVAAVEHEITDLSAAGAPRAWHRAAHALVALASAASDRASAALPQFTGSRIWQLRMYAARAAAQLGRREVLEALAKDDDDNVTEAAVEGLRKVAGHEADPLYIDGLARTGNQVVRASALALDGTPRKDEAVPALTAALQRLTAEGRDNSHDAREAIAKALANLGAAPPAQRRGSSAAASRRGSARPASEGFASPSASTDLNADDLRRLASPRARLTIRGVGVIELALFTAQAPATVLRFARLAESGYYNGLTFHRVVPNFVIQGGSPGANEYIGDSPFMRDEVGTWPHVRGAVGISTRGHDTGDAQIFIDLADNPRLDHQYTVFAQVLNGIEVVDRIIEGDVIERIEIVPGS
jgi:cyclophilin family peptidyl-prolyl cis-trans isomerase/HEAT repeat protein